ncbi:MAG: cell wall-binding repeat-containing protein, partial [Ornithinimicrobium sp.]
DTVYVTHGKALIESLVVGAAAAHTDDALLLTGRTSLAAATRSQLIALEPERVVIVADSDEISDTVLRRIRDAVNAPVTRLTTQDQYALAAEVSQGWSSTDAVYIASGIEPADALSGGAAAALDDAPLLLSADAQGLPDATRTALTELAPSNVYLLGGTARLPSATAREIRSLVPNATVSRLSGPNRYDTSAAVVKQRFGNSPRVLTANGTASIDAIAGTQLADTTGSAVLLTRKTCHPRSVSSAMDRVDAHLVSLLGGTSRLSQSSATRTC